MLAAVLEAPRRWAVRRVPLPPPGPGQVRVRLEGCGICASDLPVWEGRPWFRYPREPGSPGHEGWGRVEAAGAGVSQPRPGERVAALSFHAYAECDLAAAGALVRLPPALDGGAFPGEPLGCAVNVIERSDLHPGQTVVVVGAGFLGLLLVALAAGRGARVIAVSRRPAALEMARRLGASGVVRWGAPLEEPRGERPESSPVESPGAPGRVVEQVRRLCGDGGCERVIEAVGRQEALDLAGELPGVRGRLVIAGYHQDGPRRVDLQSWNWRGLDVVNAHERDPQVYLAGIRRAAVLVAEGALAPGPLYTHRFPLERIGEAFQAASGKPDGFLKGLIEP